MSPRAPGPFLSAGRCWLAGIVAAVVGLGLMAMVPLSHPDAAFAARVAAWRAMPPPVR